MPAGAWNRAMIAGTLSQGWSARRLGYLSEEQLGYALARFAFERGEGKPSWISFLALT